MNFFRMLFGGGSKPEAALASQDTDDASFTLPEDPLAELMTDDDIEEATWLDDGEDQDDLAEFQI